METIKDLMMRVEEAAEALACNKREVARFTCLTPIKHVGHNWYNRKQVALHIQIISIGERCEGQCKEALKLKAGPEVMRSFRRKKQKE
jgi:hypothetical protein